MHDADVWEDLLLEARAHDAVRHPGFQRLWSAELDASVPHLVLEYVEGPSLATLHAEAALTVPDVLLLGLQLASALRYLHRHRLVHLDVKPGNAVVRNGRAVLLDLGSVTPAGRVFGRLDAPGTTAYMAPEVLDEGVVTTAADVFALGTTVRELLEEAPAVPRLDDLLGRMTDPRREARPDANEVLAVLHEQLASIGCPCGPRGRSCTPVVGPLDRSLTSPSVRIWRSLDDVPADLAPPCSSSATSTASISVTSTSYGGRARSPTGRASGWWPRPSTRTRWRSCDPSTPPWA